MFAKGKKKVLGIELNLKFLYVEIGEIKKNGGYFQTDAINTCLQRSGGSSKCEFLNATPSPVSRLRYWMNV